MLVLHRLLSVALCAAYFILFFPPQFYIRDVTDSAAAAAGLVQKPRWTCMQFSFFSSSSTLIFFTTILLLSSHYEARGRLPIAMVLVFDFVYFLFIVKGHLRPFSFPLTHSRWLDAVVVVVVAVSNQLRLSQIDFK